MINFNSSKTKQKIAAVIVIVIVAAMVIGMVAGAFLYSKDLWKSDSDVSSRTGGLCEKIYGQRLL